MILEIYSVYGRLEAVPLTLQAIENSILPEHESDKQEETAVTVGDGPADSVCCEESGKTLNFDDQEIQE